jgi:predicted nucleic acid-binding protein
MLVFDASVIINILMPQRLSAAAAHWMAQTDEKLAPDFLHIEAANALWKSENAGLMDRRQTDSAWRNLQESGIRFVADRAYLTRARTMAREHNHPIYDCLYLAVAEAHEATLVTADRRLYGIAVDAVQIKGANHGVAWVEDEPLA